MEVISISRKEKKIVFMIALHTDNGLKCDLNYVVDMFTQGSIWNYILMKKMTRHLWIISHITIDTPFTNSNLCDEVTIFFKNKIKLVRFNIQR